MPDKPKPIDRWLALITTVMALLTYLFAKSAGAVVVCVVVMFALLVHPIWNFWWIEKKTWRRMIALTVAAFVLVLVAIAAWPEPAPMPTAADPISIAEDSRPSELMSKVASVFRYLKEWPWSWIVFSLLAGAVLGQIITSWRLNRRRCPYEWVHKKAIEDKANMQALVRIPGIAYQSNFAQDGPYIDFTISIFNNSLYDIAVSNTLKGEIWCQSEDTGRPKFHYEPKMESKLPIICKSRSGNSFIVRQPLRFEEIPRFEVGKKVLFGFATLELTFAGTGEFQEIGPTRLETDHYVEMDKGGWRDWNYPEFTFRFTDEQWADIRTGRIQHVREIEKLKAENKSFKSELETKALTEAKEVDLVFLRVDDVLVYHSDSFGAIVKWENKPRTTSWRQKHPTFRVLIAYYRNQPDQGRQPTAIKKLSAELTYSTSDGPVIVPRALWFPSNKDTIDIAYNDTAGFILAEHHRTTTIYGRDKKDLIELDEKELTVSVRFFSGADGSMIDGGTFKIESIESAGNSDFYATKV